jgi:hypothetical protein
MDGKIFLKDFCWHRKTFFPSQIEGRGVGAINKALLTRMTEACIGTKNTR